MRKSNRNSPGRRVTRGWDPERTQTGTQTGNGAGGPPRGRPNIGGDFMWLWALKKQDACQWVGPPRVPLGVGTGIALANTPVISRG